MQESGTIFYVDTYDTQYHVTWTTVSGRLDITTVIKQPFIWGKPITGRVQNKVAYRNGLITTTRQLIKLEADGYTIIAEGHETAAAEFPITFQCGPTPTDPFRVHFDNGVTEQVELAVTGGPRWTEPDESSSDYITWSSGFEWVNIWAN